MRLSNLASFMDLGRFHQKLTIKYNSISSGLYLDRSKSKDVVQFAFWVNGFVRASGLIVISRSYSTTFVVTGSLGWRLAESAPSRATRVADGHSVL